MCGFRCSFGVTFASCCWRCFLPRRSEVSRTDCRFHRASRPVQSEPQLRWHVARHVQRHRVVAATDHPSAKVRYFLRSCFRFVFSCDSDAVAIEPSTPAVVAVLESSAVQHLLIQNARVVIEATTLLVEPSIGCRTGETHRCFALSDLLISCVLCSCICACSWRFTQACSVVAC